MNADDARKVAREIVIQGITNRRTATEFENIIASALLAACARQREEGALAFWRAFRRALNMDHDQREYGWHDLVWASEQAFAVIRERKP